jgi:hypothetical protein
MNRMICLAVAGMLLGTGAMASSNFKETSAKDPFVGKWNLDVRHSKYPPGTCPARMVIEMEPAGQGISYHSDSTYVNGVQSQARYTADYDGKQVVVVSARGMLLPVSLKRIATNIVEATYSRGFQVVAKSRKVISKDGRRMTITTTSMSATGKSETTIGVYRKE